MNIVLIHGAKASNASWTALEAHLPQRKIYLPYKSESGFASNLQGMLDVLEGEQDLFLIGHSLGGIYALHILQHMRSVILGGCTLSTPYAGSKSADWMKYMVPTSQLLRDVGTYSRPVVESRNVRIDVPWTQLVSTSGEGAILPMESNDGVVTLASMRCREDMKKINVDANHFEILVKPVAAALVLDAVQEGYYEPYQINSGLHHASLHGR